MSVIALPICLQSSIVVIFHQSSANPYEHCGKEYNNIVLDGQEWITRFSDTAHLPHRRMLYRNYLGSRYAMEHCTISAENVA
jgi:hypothetical protein